MLIELHLPLDAVHLLQLCVFEAKLALLLGHLLAPLRTCGRLRMPPRLRLPLHARSAMRLCDLLRPGHACRRPRKLVTCARQLAGTVGYISNITHSDGD